MPLIPSGTTRRPLLRRHPPRPPLPRQAPTPSSPVPPAEEAAAAAARASRWQPPWLRLDEPTDWLFSSAACLLDLLCCKAGVSEGDWSRAIEQTARVLGTIAHGGWLVWLFIGARILHLSTLTFSLYVRDQVGLWDQLLINTFACRF